MKKRDERWVGRAIVLLTLAVAWSFGCGGKTEGTTEGAKGLVQEMSSMLNKGDEGGHGGDIHVPGKGKGEKVAESAGGGEGRLNRPLIYTRTYYSYRVSKKHDPFQPLIAEGEEGGGISLSTLVLTGILWNNQQSVAVMEDSRGMGYPLRVGDSIAGAKLVAIRRDAVVFRVRQYGEIHSVVKELVVEKEKPL